MRILLVEKNKDESVIPEGMYCYIPDMKKNENKDMEDWTYYTKTCPYWSSNEETEEGRCSFLDFEGGLLWDQVKECGINKGY